MFPVVLQDPGSNQVITIDGVTRPEWYAVSDFLAARLPFKFPDQQALRWRVFMSDIHNDGRGVIIAARHTTNLSPDSNVIGAAIAVSTGFPGEAEVVCCCSAYDSERVDSALLDALRLAASEKGWSLGRAKQQRVWEAI